MAKKKKAAAKAKAAKRQVRLADQQDGLPQPFVEAGVTGETLSSIRRICEGLEATTGVKRIVFTYAGEGDSGGIEDVTYEPKPRIEIPAPIVEKLKLCVWDFVPRGFENNDGGFGELTIDITASKITLEHNERITEVNTSEEECDF